MFIEILLRLSFFAECVFAFSKMLSYIPFQNDLLPSCPLEEEDFCNKKELFTGGYERAYLREQTGGDNFCQVFRQRAFWQESIKSWDLGDHL